MDAQRRVALPVERAAERYHSGRFWLGGDEPGRIIAISEAKCGNGTGDAALSERIEVSAA